MKVENKSVYAAIGLAIIAVMGWSCATQRTNLVSNGTISLEKTPDEDFYISRAYVYQEGEEILITGHLANRGAHEITLGHMDVAIIAPDGSVLNAASARLIGPPRHSRHRGYSHREYRFSFRFQGIPPNGSTVRLALHEPNYSQMNTFDCGDNKAIKEAGER